MVLSHVTKITPPIDGNHDVCQAGHRAISSRHCLDRDFDHNILPSIAYPDIDNYCVYSQSAYTLNDLKRYKILKHTTSSSVAGCQMFAQEKSTVTLL